MTDVYDKSRPLFHFTPQQNWMNDPNGLVFIDGEYHLFFQHNPYGKHWGHMSWGHAVSPDLVHWEHLPNAIWEEPGAGYTIFSGSAVIDVDNTAGFGKNAMIAVYTADYTLPEKKQDVHIACSTDGGRTFRQYKHNPVISTGEAKYGDPKVFWYEEEQKWVMVNICHRPQDHVEMYNSPDLRAWVYMSSFHADDIAPGIWECPDLFPLEFGDGSQGVKWVLKINNTRYGEGPAATCYFIGDFDGKTFSNASPAGQGLTSGEGAIYAEVTYNAEPLKRRVLMGWLRQEEYDTREWTGAMAIPRELSLQFVGSDYVLCQQPITEVTSLRQEHTAVHLKGCSLEDGSGIDIDLQSQAVEVWLELHIKKTQRAGLRLMLASEQELFLGYDPLLARLFCIIGGKVIWSPFTPLKSAGEYQDITLRLFLDRAVVELFGDTHAALTTCLPYGTQYKSLSVYSDHGPVIVNQLDAWVLAP